MELSIVLVILGLLTGGILAGQSLIRAAELRAVATEYSRWTTATNAFRDKYFAIPGDMNNATQFWGSSAACPGTAGTGTQTCDGNGDGIITLGSVGDANKFIEPYTFWQHLANAGLIEGSYTGMSGSGGPTDSTVSNSPRSKLSNALWFSWNWNNTYAGNPSVFDGTYKDNLLQFGSNGAAAYLKPEEAWNIDTKIDDGRPAYGVMRERSWSTCTTAASSADYAAAYKLNVSTIVCIPFFYNK